MRHRFHVIGTFDRAGGVTHGSVVVDRATGIFEARARRRRRVYAMPLSTVADMVCRTIILAELREKRAAKRARRRGR